MNYSSKTRNNTQVAIVTMDRSQWVKKAKFQWIFWLAVLLSLSVLMGACKGSGSSDANIDPSDTAGLAAFNAQKTADSLAGLPADQQERLDDRSGSQTSQSFTSNTDDGADNGDNTGATKSINDENGAAVDNNSGGSENDQTATTTTKKKRFSNASKGAVIGAGSGAVIGAIVAKKNRGLGAVIGAAVGGGAGYGIGKHKDKKQAEETN